MSATIKSIKAREVLDSRGNPTVEVELKSDKKSDKNTARAIVPSGASTGTHEAVELRDSGRRYHGKGVLSAVKNVNTVISKTIKGKGFSNQAELDETLIKLDGTPNKSRLGANAVLGVSLAFARLSALENGIPLYRYLGKSTTLPVPFCNVINGGKHAANPLSIQEFMIAPVNAKSFSDGIRIVCEVYHTLKGLLQQKYGRSSTNVGDEGGFAPMIDRTEDALEIVTNAVDVSGYNKEIMIALDCAATEFYESKIYTVDSRKMNSGELSDFYAGLMKNYKIVSIEDPFHEEQFKEFADFTKRFGKKVQIVGDDLLVTNIERLRKAVEMKSCNCLLLKVNQIGTLTEALDASRYAFKNDWNVMVSHRSGETEDTFIADLSVGIGCGQIKTGGPSRSERTSKYNQLLRIEEELRRKGKKPKYGKKLLC